MDIGKLMTRPAHDAGAEFLVVGEDGVPTDFYIRVVGPDSAKWRDITRRIVRARFSGEDDFAEKERHNLLAEATLSWRGLTDNGEPVEFSPEIAAGLYLNAPKVADQVDGFIADRVNFTNPAPQK